MEFNKELVGQFEAVKERLVLIIEKHSNFKMGYGGSKVEIYPESPQLPGDDPNYHGGLYLMANGQFVDKRMLQGTPTPATPKEFVLQYIKDCDKKLMDAWLTALEAWGGRITELGYRNPLKEVLTQESKLKNSEILDNTPSPPDLEGMIDERYSQERLDVILSEGIRMMEEATTKKPYTDLLFLQVTSDQIIVVQ